MADTHYYPFRLTDTVLTDSDFGFGSGVFGGWISDLENGVNGAVVVYKWTQAYHTDTVKAGETTAQNVNTHLLDLVVSVTTKIDLDVIVFDTVDLVDATIQNFDLYNTDTIKAGEMVTQDISYTDLAEIADSTEQEFETNQSESLTVWEYDQNYLDKANPTASGTSETKPTASGTSETKPTASGTGIKDVDD
jgi:hypothetical protein